jgi:phenylalanyl-tRNA synthetase alpha chain
MSYVLHTLEKKILRVLAKEGKLRIEDVARLAGIEEDQARRAAEWLKTKGLVNVKEKVRVFVTLGKEGREVIKKGLPERRLVEIINFKGKRAKVLEVTDLFSKEEFSAALGRARQLGWVKAEKGELILTDKAFKKSMQESTLEWLSKVEGIYEDEIDNEKRKVLKELERRPRFIEKKFKKIMEIELSEQGRRKLPSLRLKEEFEIESLTPQLLISGEWRRYKLREFDVEAPSPVIYPGKKHPLQRFIDEVREIFVSLGFEEVEGPLVQPCFWNFDALFIPQDHPAREMQDTFYLSRLKVRSIDERFSKEVKRVHEDGGDTGSKGWGYEWKLEESKRLVLRTHTTAITINYLAMHKPEEARVFSVGRVFRNEKVTYKNLVEFHQIEGIVVGERVSIRDLMGLLTKFYNKLGLKEVKFWPSYFPYTEPSLQSVVYHDKLGRWVELCGMGIFRPEVTLPFGVKNPVLAWGGGLERLVMLRYGINDVRELYKNDLSWLRRVSLCQ